jgi:3-isopropylmalate dehydrogenase
MSSWSNPTFRIAVLPGDGIGADVIASAVAILRRVEELCGDFSLSLSEYSVGAAEYLRNGDPLPAAAMAGCREADAILLGAMGLPHVRWPDGREMAPQLDLREQLDLYCGVRPVRLLHSADTPLKNWDAGTIDLVIVRENCEGLFSTRLRPRIPEADEASDELRVTRRGAERIFRAAFRLARDRRRKVTLVDKANVLPSMVLFREVFDQVARDFPEIESERLYVDATALYLLQNPGRFDVLVTENMFGDILSDLAAGLVGGMGMAPSADIGEEWAVFQPSHGSAPDIAGQGIANPVAAILSAAMMLDWLDTPATTRGAGLIRQAVSRVFADPHHRTPDLRGNLTTTEMTNRIADNLRV